MTLIEDRLEDLGLTLPEVPVPLAGYVPAVRDGNYIFTAGQLPLVNGGMEISGKVGDDVSVEAAADLARICALNALAAIKAEIGDLDRIRRIVKVVGFVASAPGFTNQPAVIDGASELLSTTFGDRGRHARSAVGVAELPRGAAVEVELIVSIDQ